MYILQEYINYNAVEKKGCVMLKKVEDILLMIQNEKSNFSRPGMLKTTMAKITSSFCIHDFPVPEKVEISKAILAVLSREQRMELAKDFLDEQVVLQRIKLNHWSSITAQSAQIDTGYIAQHLVSLQTQIPGQGMRGKGDDLSDGSEVKSANFLDSLDKKGAVAPRWNFTAVTREIMERFLAYPTLYLLSMDLNTSGKFRTRIWKVDVSRHTVLQERYKEWMDKLGYPKFENEREASVNFQLFPPHTGTDENFARHGKGQQGGFSKLNIALEDGIGSVKVFHAEEKDGKIEILTF